MLRLEQLQREMARAIMSGETMAVAAEIAVPEASAAARFAIYRNNTFLSLTRHLKTVFPVTARVGDERFFLYAAHEFIRRHPPGEARLAFYGGDFPKFLSRFPPAQSAPILSEMAAFEWAVHRALIKDELAPLPLERLSNLRPDSARLRLELQRSLSFVLSRWPVMRLWASDGKAGEPPARRFSRIAVFRRGDKVRAIELRPARFGFWRNLHRGEDLEKAAARALARDPRFDLINEIQTLFGEGLVTALGPLNDLEQGGPS